MHPMSVTIALRARGLHMDWKYIKGNVKNPGGVWFGCFLFSFSLKTENGDENVFDWIFENIFSENENRKQAENENNKFSFSVENKNLISDKMKLW